MTLMARLLVAAECARAYAANEEPGEPDARRLAVGCGLASAALLALLVWSLWK